MTTSSPPRKLRTPPKRPGWTIRRWRRLVGAVLAITAVGLPFVHVGGESALRFDIPSLRLHFFGTSIWMNEFFVVLAGTLFLVFLFLLVTLAFGRIWCGWMCPQTVLSEYTRFFLRWRQRGGAPALIAHAAVLGLCLVVGASALWYFIEPVEMMRRLFAGTLPPAAWATWALLSWALYVDLSFVRQRFCTGVCPYAKIQGALFDAGTLVVAYDRRREADCVDCGACARVCPTGIDIRGGLQTECIACGQCIDACEPIMRRLGRPPKLVGWFFGEPGHPRRLRRPAVVALATTAAASFVLTIGVAASRTPLDLVVSPSQAFTPRRAASGQAVNAFQLALENRSRSAMEVRLGLEVADIVFDVRPAVVQLLPGEHRRLTVVAEGAVPGPPRRIEASFRAAFQTTASAGAAAMQVERRVAFVNPEER